MEKRQNRCGEMEAFRKGDRENQFPPPLPDFNLCKIYLGTKAIRSSNVDQNNIKNSLAVHKCVSGCKLALQCTQLSVVSIFSHFCAVNIKRGIKERKVYKNQMRQKSGKQREMGK